MVKNKISILVLLLVLGGCKKKLYNSKHCFRRKGKLHFIE